jgi:SAM-dependent methyltransferase
MPEVFCTLFDRNYVSRGLVLHRSLARVCESFRLWVFCMDEESERVVRRLALPHVQIVSLAELEARDPALLSTKAARTQVEYCWTATPATCLRTLELDPDASGVTYLDADLRFFSNPQVLFDELGEDATLIVPHRYAPEHRHKEPTSGTYNVEWLTFRRDEDGLAALQWWHDRCIEWCFFRWEDGKLGDQKYLEQFPARFRRVHVLEHPGGGLAPWNVTAHELAEGSDGVPLVDGLPLVFYHYHSLRLYGSGPSTTAARLVGRVRSGPFAWTTNYPVSDEERRLVWDPYLHDLAEAAASAGDPTPVPYPPAELAAAARRVVVRGLAAARRRLPARNRGGEGWHTADVAAQMVELTELQLRDPEAAAPYRAFLRLLPTILDDGALPSPASFLDIGCGAGGYAELLERYAPGRFEYVGADESEEILAAARARLPGVRFERRDLFEPGAVDGFDVVLASALLDVLPKPEDALDALLRSDGRWVILHRQRVGRSGVAVVAGYRGQRTPEATISPEQLSAAAERHGRTLADEIVVERNVRSFLLRRSDDC